MSEPFKASFLKIERAQHHLQELEGVIADYLAANPVRWTSEIEAHPETKSAIVRMSFNHDAMPSVTSAILGDFFHNLRSSLDLVVANFPWPWIGS